MLEGCREGLRSPQGLEQFVIFSIYGSVLRVLRRSTYEVCLALDLLDHLDARISSWMHRVPQSRQLLAEAHL